MTLAASLSDTIDVKILIVGGAVIMDVIPFSLGTSAVVEYYDKSNSISEGSNRSNIG